MSQKILIFKMAFSLFQPDIGYCMVVSLYQGWKWLFRTIIRCWSLELDRHCSSVEQSGRIINIYYRKILQCRLMNLFLHILCSNHRVPKGTGNSYPKMKLFGNKLNVSVPHFQPCISLLSPNVRWPSNNSYWPSKSNMNIWFWEIHKEITPRETKFVVDLS